MRQHLEPSYLLHRRPFRESSQIIEVLCVNSGRLSLVVRGTHRRRRGGSYATLLQPFRPLLVSYSGRGELATLTAVEVAGDLPPLQGDALLSAFYLNELLLRLLHRHEAHETIFAAYAATLGALAECDPVEPALRNFEFILLEELGYRIDLTHDEMSGSTLEPQALYQLYPETGLRLAGEGTRESKRAYRGEDLLAIADGEYRGERAPVAKRLVRELLAPHLGDKPLRSRTMFARNATGGDR